MSATPADVVEYQLVQARAGCQPGKEEVPRVPLARLLAVTALTASLTAGQLVLAQMTHCITLLVLVHYNIYNVLTLTVAAISAVKRGPSLQYTFGWRRLEVVGSLSSLVFLFSLCFATMVEALQTLFHTDHLDTMHHPEWVLILAGADIAVWLVALTAFGGYSALQGRAVGQCRNGSVRAAELTRDLQGPLFTSLTSSLVWLGVVTPEYSAYLDPLVSLVYIMTVCWSSAPLVRDSCLILLQTIPGNVEVSLLKSFLLTKFPGIVSVHEFHVWTLTPGCLVLTGHLTYASQDQYHMIHDQVEQFFLSQGFSQITIQPEFAPATESEEELAVVGLTDDCNLRCKDDRCVDRTCCNSPPSS